MLIGLRRNLLVEYDDNSPHQAPPAAETAPQQTQDARSSIILSRSTTSSRSHFSSSSNASPLPRSHSYQSRTASKPAILCPIGRSDNTRSDQKRFSAISRELNLVSFALNKARGSGSGSCDHECKRGCGVNGGTSETRKITPSQPPE